MAAFSHSALGILLALVGVLPAGAQALSPVVVSGPDVTITEEDLELELQVFPQGRQRQIVSDPALFRELVNVFYRRARMAEVAREEGLDRDPVMQHRFRRMQEERLAEAAQEDFTASLEVPELTRLARSRYEASLEEYRVPERVRVRHILLAAEGEDELAARRVEARELRERAVAGEPFDELAQSYSEDPGSREEGGDLGFFARDTMVPEFEDAAFALQEPGDIGEPVETQFGIHLIKLVEREEARVRPFEEVREVIEGQLRTEYIRNEVRMWRQEVADPEAASLDDAALRRVLEGARQRLGVE